MSQTNAKFILYFFITSLLLLPQTSFSKLELKTELMQGAQDETLPLEFGHPQSGTLPAPTSEGCLLNPVQYKFSVPEGECEPVDSLFTPLLRADQNVKLYVRFGQRVSVENGRIVADYVADSGAATDRQIAVGPTSNPALRSGDYYVAISNCGQTPAAFTLSLIRGFVDYFGPLRVITRAEVIEKELLVYGCFPKKDAKLLLNGVKQKHTIHDEERRKGLVIAKKAGALIALGQTVTIQLLFPDGTRTNLLTFIRPAKTD